MFKKDFVWGAATSAYQIEGAAYEDGKRLSVWDVFTANEFSYKGETGEVACDHYHRYEEDVKLMKEMGINSYRFSLAWTRILPEGTGKVNQKGIDFYNRLIDCLLENGITPYATLFHWDYPQALEVKGNWSNPDSPKWFQEYVEVVFKAFGDRVKHFITFNEPQCFIGTGYGADKLQAPGIKFSDGELVLKAHHVLLAHGLAVQSFRRLVPDGKIGYAPTGTPAIPASNSKADIDAAREEYFDVPKDGWTWNVSWWSDPVILCTYPKHTEMFARLEKFLPSNYEEDLKIISQPIDFYCQNIYNGYMVKAGKNGREYIPNSVGTPMTTMQWPVTPAALYWGPRFLYERYGLPIIISENGMACPDMISGDGKVHDQSRICFMEQYLKELERAIDDGVDVVGYMYWSLMDNFEWGHGYRPRFGLIHVDYQTQKRTPKDSYYWYREFIQSRK